MSSDKHGARASTLLHSGIQLMKIMDGDALPMPQAGGTPVISYSALFMVLGASITFAFIGLAIFIVRTVPSGVQARVLAATAALMAAIPSVLFALYR